VSWRFRRSIGLGKGVRINLSKSGVGLSVGGKVVRAGVGPRGAYRTFRIPGTGLYHMEYLDTKKKRKAATAHRQDTAAAASGIPPELAPKGLTLGCLGILSALVLLAIWWPVGLLVLGTGIYLNSTTASSRARKHFIKARQAQGSGQVEEAVREYQQVLDLVPTVPIVNYNLAYLYWEQGLIPEAEQAFRAYLVSKPEDYSAKYALAELLRKKGDLDEALQLLNQLPADIRKQVPVLNSQAQIYWNQNKPELALAVLELGPWRQQKAMDQATMDYRYLMAQVLLTLGKDKRALTQLRRIFAQNPDYKDVASLITQLTGN
jgi:tetratricopeptide (TPR) repeat protein